MSVVRTDDEWTLQARCRGMADALFPEGKDQKRARVVCMGCPVRANCLAEALDNRIEWGVWGGLTERERRQLLRQRPDVQSWAEVLLSSEQEETRRSLPGAVNEVMQGCPDPTAASARAASEPGMLVDDRGVRPMPSRSASSRVAGTPAMAQGTRPRR